jgi:hypothetical protein
MPAPQILSDIGYWTLPPGIYRLGGLLKRALTHRIDAETRSVLARNVAFKDREAGKRGFLLGCGPSINQHDLTLLKDEVCISVSNFFVHDDFDAIGPGYHCVSGLHPPIELNTYLAWLRDIEESSGDLVLVSPIKDREDIERAGVFKDREVCYAQPGATATDLKRGGLDFTRRVRSHETIAVLALELAIYLGLKEIYLLGFDFDYVNHIGVSTHFYSEDKHRFVREGYDEWFNQNFAVYCEQWIDIWSEFELLNQIADARGIKILNATEGGLLDIYPCVRYASLFEDFSGGGLQKGETSHAN